MVKITFFENCLLAIKIPPAPTDFSPAIRIWYFPANGIVYVPTCCTAEERVLVPILFTSYTTLPEEEHIFSMHKGIALGQSESAVQDLVEPQTPLLQ